MQLDDMILVSIDDHVVEPPDMFERHSPAKYRDQAPQRRRSDDGIEQWVFEGHEVGTIGLNASSAWPKEEWGFDPVASPRCAPARYDVHERVRDMNAQRRARVDVLPVVRRRSAAGMFIEATDKDLALGHASRPTTTGTSTSGAAPTPVASSRSRSRRSGTRRMVARDAPRRREGLPRGHHPRAPAPHGPAQLPRPRLLGPVLRRRVDEHGIVDVPPHRPGLGAIITRARRSVDNLIVARHPGLGARGAGPAVGSRCCASTPTSRSRWSEGGIGWIPYFLDRVDRHYREPASGPAHDFGDKLPSEVFREHVARVLHHRPVGAEAATDIGIDIIAWECDYPHSDSLVARRARSGARRVDGAGCSDDEIDKITWENALPLLRLRPVRAHAARGAHGRRAAGAGARRRHARRIHGGVAEAVRGAGHSPHTRSGSSLGPYVRPTTSHTSTLTKIAGASGMLRSMVEGCLGSSRVLFGVKQPERMLNKVPVVDAS